MTTGDAAVKAIGENPRDNIDLRPREHAANLTGDPVAGPLLEIFAAQVPLPGRNRSKPINVKETIELYCSHDESALKHQRQYDLSKMIIMTSLMLAIIVSGLVTLLGLPRDVNLNAYPWLQRYGVPVDPEWYKNHVDWITRPGVVLIAYWALILPLFTAWWAGRRQFYENWQRRRGEAEFLRRRLFEEVMDAEPPSDARNLGRSAADAKARHGAPTLLRLKLEYFRRYQLDLQREYYKVKGAENRARVARVKRLLIPCILVVALWFLTFVLELVSAASDQGLWFGHPLGLLNVVTSPLQELMTRRLDNVALIIALAMSAFLAFLYVRVLLDANLRNAARYAVAEANLTYLGKDALAAARAAADNDEMQAVQEFVNRVHSVMSTEHADWVRLQELEMGRETSSGVSAAAPRGATS